MKRIDGFGMQHPLEPEVDHDHDDRVSTTLLGFFALLWATVSAGMIVALAWMVWQALGWWILGLPPALAALVKVSHMIGSRIVQSWE